MHRDSCDRGWRRSYQLLLARGSGSWQLFTVIQRKGLLARLCRRVGSLACAPASRSDSPAGLRLRNAGAWRERSGERQLPVFHHDVARQAPGSLCSRPGTRIRPCCAATFAKAHCSARMPPLWSACNRRLLSALPGRLLTAQVLRAYASALVRCRRRPSGFRVVSCVTFANVRYDHSGGGCALGGAANAINGATSLSNVGRQGQLHRRAITLLASTLATY